MTRRGLRSSLFVDTYVDFFRELVHGDAVAKAVVHEEMWSGWLIFVFMHVEARRHGIPYPWLWMLVLYLLAASGPFAAFVGYISHVKSRDLKASEGGGALTELVLFLVGHIAIWASLISIPTPGWSNPTSGVLQPWKGHNNPVNAPLPDTLAQAPLWYFMWVMASLGSAES